MHFGDGLPTLSTTAPTLDPASAAGAAAEGYIGAPGRYLAAGAVGYLFRGYIGAVIGVALAYMNAPKTATKVPDVGPGGIPKAQGGA